MNEELEVQKITYTSEEVGQFSHQQASTFAQPEMSARVHDASNLGGATIAGMSRQLNQSNVEGSRASGQVYDPA